MKDLRRIDPQAGAPVERSATGHERMNRWQALAEIVRILSDKDRKGLIAVAILTISFPSASALGLCLWIIAHR